MSGLGEWDELMGWEFSTDGTGREMVSARCGSFGGGFCYTFACVEGASKGDKMEMKV